MSLIQMNLTQMSFYGAIMILAIILVRAMAINKLPKKVFVLLWKLALLRLLIPFSIPSMLSAYSFVGRNRSVQDTLAEIPAAAISQVTEGQPGTNTVVAAAAREDVSDLSVWFVLWVVGAALCAVFFAVSYLRCHLEFRMSIPVRNGFAVKWTEEHRLRRSIRIRQSDRISAPLTYGIFRPVILMPKNTDWENSQQLQYVLLHEYIHIRRFDMLWKLIAVLALCFHWFNPFVWIMYLLFNRDIELSCDESVVRQFGESSKANYARTLIYMEEKKSGLMPLCNNFSKNAIEERITAIMRIKKITIGVLIISAIVPVMIVVLFATSVKKESVSDNAGKGIVAEGIEVPGAVLEAAKRLVGQRYTDVQDGGCRDWRIESLTHAYTYDNLDGATLQVYRMNYEFLADDPENITLVGGMTMDEDGWVVPEYADSTYLIFSQEGETISYLTFLIENDCFPGDEVFTEDLKQQLGQEPDLQTDSLKSPEESVIRHIMVSFYTAYFSGDADEMKQYLSESFDGEIESYENPEIAGEIDIREIKGMDSVTYNVGDKCTLSLEFCVPGEDSLTYLTVEFIKENAGWKISSYGLEK